MSDETAAGEPIGPAELATVAATPVAAPLAPAGPTNTARSSTDAGVKVMIASFLALGLVVFGLGTVWLLNRPDEIATVARENDPVEIDDQVEEEELEEEDDDETSSPDTTEAPDTTTSPETTSPEVTSVPETTAPDLSLIHI